MQKILELISENNGNLSNTRLNSTMMIWAGIAILVGGAFHIQSATLDPTSISAAMGLIVAGSGQKLIQKQQEIKADECAAPVVEKKP